MVLMKKVWIKVKKASLENRLGCCIDSISTKHSSLTNTSKKCGRSEMKTVKIRGANCASKFANQSYFNTGSRRNGKISVSASTLESDAMNETGIVQKTHSRIVRKRLMSCPIFLL